MNIIHLNLIPIMSLWKGSLLCDLIFAIQCLFCSINCDPRFGDDIDDSKLEDLIQREIIDGQAEREEKSPSPEPEREVVSGTDVAANIMAKMGYTLGSGLGKHGQGMSSALKVEKKSGQAGKIVSEVDEVMRCKCW